MTCTKDCSKPYDKVDGLDRKIERLPDRIGPEAFQRVLMARWGVFSLVPEVGIEPTPA